MKNRFPLLFAVFRQVAPGIAHEANVERVNSTAQRLSDPNMNPETLRRYVYIARNADIYGIDLKEVRQRYKDKYGALSLAPEKVIHYVCMRACNALHVFMYVSMYACMCVRVCVYACMYVCVYDVYLCIFVCMHARMYVCVHILYVCIHVRMYVCVYACMYACMCVCIYACICMYI